MKFLLIALLLAASAAAQSPLERLDRDLSRAAADLHISDLRAEISKSGRVIWHRGAVPFCARTASAGTQQVSGSRVEWWFQSKCMAIALPARRLALTVSSNSSALTKAPRLEDGNLLRSTIALAFLKDVAGLADPEPDELIDRALVALYLGPRATSKALARQALDQFPELETEPDVTLLYLFSKLDFDETESSATAVIKAHPDLPTAWFYYAQFVEKGKRYREAAACYHKITDHQPPWHSWTVAAAREELTHLETPQ